MASFLIEGGARLSGTFRPMGNKNAVLPMLAASLLTDEPVVLHAVPDIADVRVMLSLLDSIGVGVSFADRTVTLCAARIRRRRFDPDLCRRVRSSILLAGPMTARHGGAVLHPPGGDLIGRRRVDAHFEGLRKLGIQIDPGPPFVFRRRALSPASILLDEASVTATENIMMAAALIPGETVLYNAACEPHVQDLGTLLRKMGADIDGLGTNRLRIVGRASLHGASHEAGPDLIEAGSFLAAAAATGGSLDLAGVPDDVSFQVVARGFSRLGVEPISGPDPWSYRFSRALRIPRRWHGAVPKIEDGPWPAFPSDLMSVALVLATQARGEVLFFEKMFESRMYFVDRLIEMGARIVACDPHRVVVSGPSRLHGCTMSSPDIRAGMSLIIAALCARGTSRIENAQMVDRGYANVDVRLRSLGARIQRVDD